MSDTPNIKRFEEWAAEYGVHATNRDVELQTAAETHAARTMLNDLAEHIEELAKHILTINTFLGLNESHTTPHSLEEKK